MNTNVIVGQLMPVIYMISILNPSIWGQTSPAQPFSVHLEHLSFGKGRGLGEGVGALLSQHWVKGEQKKELQKPLIMCNVNASVTHQRLCHCN